MTDPRDPRYPEHQTDPRDPRYPEHQADPATWAYGPPAQPAQPARGPGLAARLGDRAIRRPAPRLGVSLAGAGVALAVFGVLVWGGDYLTSAHRSGGGGGGGFSRHLVGVGLSLLVVVVGYALTVTRQRGPLATAGVVASALGVPVLIGFLTFDTSHRGQSGPPFSLDAIVLVSVFAWVLSYLVVRGARGHAFYLGLAAIIIWPYLLDKAEPKLFDLASFVRVILGNPGLFGRARSGPDWTTVAVISLMFGLGYYLIAFILDRVGRPGPGAALAVAGFLATVSGLSAASVNLHATGTGVALIVLGLVLAGFGARGGRRFTTWVWSAGVAVGVVTIIADVVKDNSAAAGVALIISGAVVVLAGHLLAGAWHEPDDLAPEHPGPPAMGIGQRQY